MSNLLTNIGRRIKAAIYYSQEFTLWLPGMALLAMLGFVLIGALTPMTGDALAWLGELPVLCAYAAAALGAAWVIKKVYLHDVDSNEERELHAAARAGDAGARWVLMKDRLETFTCIVLTLAFFWPAR
ncbi:hypothetical protein [Lysobacter enzymogenes]|uniref:hypothetical protein n=1 Tax=Lysobacter enzymogenes TaxID=69 RepID=UPI00099E1073|nr:hypothetical protein [Lysobacter enzymogenes]UZW62753.1 hypothetical protein BV903_010865 [Lysobacter enzymogenes]